VFLDADKEGYIDHLRTRMSKLRARSFVLVHSINARQTHPPFMKAIPSDPDLDKVVRGGRSISIKKKQLPRVTRNEQE
jgi:caffeoyl-CoA O-methyltransferase